MATTLNFTLEARNLERVRAQIAQLGRAGVAEASVKAVNDVAFQVRRAMQEEMRTVFDRPTPYVVQSVRVQQATVDRPEALILPTYMGGKGVDPQKVLQAQAQGGSRRDKRSEVALRRAGVLPSGYQTAIPREPYPGSDDGRGNLRGPFVVQLLSYLQAFGEQGYRANMTARRRERLAQRGTSASGAARIGGVVFFVAYGRLRGGPTAHLEPGIWAKSGTHGAVLRPVVLFVRRGSYQRRLDMQGIARKVDVQRRFESRLRYRIRSALGQ